MNSPAFTANVNDADVIVIGAGIQGVGVAQALAVKGVKVIVVEAANAAATETSCKSSKLIHGGLRYLETAQLALVYECLRERKILARLAPHLVTLKPFYIPVYRGQKRAPWMIYGGLWLYRLLGGGPFKRHGKQKAAELGLNAQGLRALFEYRDAQTDDAALTRAVLASAQHFGAHITFDFAVKQIQTIEQGYCVVAADGRRLIAPCVVNAAGPWINNIANASNDLPHLGIELVQGSHLILNLPAPKGCIYTESPDDGRAVFLLPWQGQLMVGTTELSRGNDASKNEVTQAEQDYLLRVVAHALNQPELSSANIVAAFSGVRVLPSTVEKGSAQTKSPNVKARETRFVHALTDQRQYLAIYGGKLTAYRATAQKVAAMLLPYLAKNASNNLQNLQNPTATDNIAL